MDRMQLVCWPWNGPISLKESFGEMTQYHIIHNWLWLGSVESLDEAPALLRTQAGFDHDGYKILCKPLMAGKFDITVLPKPGQ